MKNETKNTFLKNPTRKKIVIIAIIAIVIIVIFAMLSKQNLESNIAISNNQTGGQTANTIINNTPIKRTLEGTNKQIIVSLLKSQPSEKIILTIVNNDEEAKSLGMEIKALLAESSWEVEGPSFSVYGAPMTGVIFYLKNYTGSELTNSQTALINWLNENGIKTILFPEESEENQIIVGTNTS